MKMRWFEIGTVMAALPALAIPCAWAQAGSSQDHSTGKLTRVVPPSESREDTGDFDRAAWKKQITAGDLGEREAAFDRLAGIARHDPAAREALESWAKDTSDSGLAWTSRLILREADRGAPGWMPGGTNPGRSLFGEDFDGFAQRFDDLDSMFGDLRSQWDLMMQHLPSPSANGTGTNSSESMTLQSGPDGVTCKVTEKVDGKETTHEYTAKSMDELLEANPELRQKLGNGGPMVFTLPNGGPRSLMVLPRNGGLGGRARTLPRAYRGGVTFQDEDAGPAGEPRTDRLGIFCAPVDDESAQKLGLSAGDGLRVQSTQPGSIASILGLRTGDVVVEINGSTIRSAEDVQKVLSARAEGAEVSVVVVGSEGRRTLTWKPAAKKTDSSESKSGTRSL